MTTLTPHVKFVDGEPTAWVVVPLQTLVFDNTRIAKMVKKNIEPKFVLSDLNAVRMEYILMQATNRISFSIKLNLQIIFLEEFKEYRDSIFLKQPPYREEKMKLIETLQNEMKKKRFQRTIAYHVNNSVKEISDALQYGDNFELYTFDKTVEIARKKKFSGQTCYRCHMTANVVMGDNWKCNYCGSENTVPSLPNELHENPDMGMVKTVIEAAEYYAKEVTDNEAY